MGGGTSTPTMPSTPAWDIQMKDGSIKSKVRKPGFLEGNEPITYPDINNLNTMPFASYNIYWDNFFWSEFKC